MFKYDLYTVDMNRERNCYSCRGFSYIARNYRNQRIIGREKRLEYRNNLNTINNLNRKENLIVLDQVLVITIGL